MPLWRVSTRPLRAGVARLLMLLVLSASVVPAIAGLAPGRAGAVPPDVLDERALAIASPSLVYLETVNTGYIRDKQTNQPVLASPVTYNRRCSGFVVNPDGHVATTRICVSPPAETILQQVLYVAGFALIGEHQLDQAQLDSWVTDRMSTTVFTGVTDDSKPEAQLYGQLNVATGAITSSPAIHGTVVKVSEPNNVALVKLDQGNLPAVALADDGTLATGTQVTALGFDTTDADPRVGTYTAAATPVQIVGSGKDDTATYYRLNQTLGTYVHGGMAIDATGHVVGMLNEDPTLPNNANRAIYPASVVTALLADAGVHNTLGASDKRFRSGLDAYFGGQYSTAISDLGQVAKAVPTNRIAPIYRQYATDRKTIEGDSSGLGSWFKPAVAGVGGGLLGAFIVALVMMAGRNRRRAAANNWDPYAPPPTIYRAPGPEVPATVTPPQTMAPQTMPPQTMASQTMAAQTMAPQPVSPSPTAESAWPLFPSRYAQYDVDPFAATSQPVPQQQPAPEQPAPTQQPAPNQPAPDQQSMAPDQQPMAPDQQSMAPDQQPMAQQPHVPHQPQAADRDASPDAPWNVVWPVPTQVPTTVQVPAAAPVSGDAPGVEAPVSAEGPGPATGRGSVDWHNRPGPGGGNESDDGAGSRSPWAVPPTQP
jgi:hypothetical protein